MFEKILDILQKSNVGKYYLIIGCAVFIISLIFGYLGSDNVIKLLNSSWVKYQTIDFSKKLLFGAIIFLVLSIVFAGVLETYMAEKHKVKLDDPTIILYILNTIVGLCLIGLSITSVYSIILFLLIYFFFTIVDYLFRNNISFVVKNVIERLKNDGIIGQEVHKALTVYYFEYPIKHVTFIRLFLTFICICLFCFSNTKIIIDIVAYIMIVVIFLNEIVSWYYRLRLFNKVSENHA